MTQKTNQNPWTMDVRVRERNLKSGALTDKDLEKYLANLPDVADQAEPFGTAQPALAQQPVVAEPEASSAASFADEDVADEDEDEDEVSEEPVAVAAPEPAPIAVAPEPAPAAPVEEPAAPETGAASESSDGSDAPQSPQGEGQPS